MGGGGVCFWEDWKRGGDNNAHSVEWILKSRWGRPGAKMKGGGGGDVCTYIRIRFELAVEGSAREARGRRAAGAAAAAVASAATPPGPPAGLALHV